MTRWYFIKFYNALKTFLRFAQKRIFRLMDLTFVSKCNAIFSGDKMKCSCLCSKNSNESVNLFEFCSWKMIEIKPFLIYLSRNGKHYYLQHGKQYIYTLNKGYKNECDWLVALLLLQQRMFLLLYGSRFGIELIYFQLIRAVIIQRM